MTPPFKVVIEADRCLFIYLFTHLADLIWSLLALILFSTTSWTKLSFSVVMVTVKLQNKQTKAMINCRNA